MTALWTQEEALADTLGQAKEMGFGRRLQQANFMHCLTPKRTRAAEMWQAENFPELEELEARAVNKCGDCVACCKALEVPALRKSGGSWCEHAAPRSGCAIYEDRPMECSAWSCWWRRLNWPAEYRPDRSKILVFELPGNIVKVEELSPGSLDGAKARRIVRYLQAEGLCTVMSRFGGALTKPRWYSGPVPISSRRDGKLTVERFAT